MDILSPDITFVTPKTDEIHGAYDSSSVPPTCDTGSPGTGGRTGRQECRSRHTLLLSSSSRQRTRILLTYSEVSNLWESKGRGVPLFQFSGRESVRRYPENGVKRVDTYGPPRLPRLSRVVSSVPWVKSVIKPSRIGPRSGFNISQFLLGCLSERRPSYIG